jgi:hypothetical protein
MAKQPRVTVGLRLPPSSKAEMRTVLEALADDGQSARQEDLVGALLHRAAALVSAQRDLRRLGADVRAQKARAKKEGF